MPSGGRGGRLADAQDAARRGVAEAQRLAEEARGRSPLVRRGFDIVDRDRRHLGGLLAGAVAYRLFLWLLPFSLMVVGLLGALTDVDENGVTTLGDNLALQGLLTETLQEGGRARGWWIALVIGLFGSLYAGIGAVRAVRISHAAAWGIVPERLRKPVHASAALLAIAAGMLVAAGLAGWARDRSGPGGLLVTLALTLLYFVVWLRISVWLPHRGVSTRALVPGAALVAVGLQGLHLFTVYFLASKAERATSLYGTIGAALVLLLWLYIIARLAVGSAVVNAELSRPPAAVRTHAEETNA